ncbi:GNAT family N-acetyltransferase [Endozoicomonas atrinae]|uniref:GNAT family N-acetyltransferase n=1 Tax=Endozoicomonas atrinae TaxID=1333660 RepID=UPI0008257FC1|nr:GNAT family N-acetyltransferase [Endozoicomonas atrinae]
MDVFKSSMSARSDRCPFEYGDSTEKKRENNKEPATFKNYRVSVVDRNDCTSSLNKELVTLVNEAYGFQWIDEKVKDVPTSRYFCLFDGDKVLACAGFISGNLAHDKLVSQDRAEAKLGPMDEKVCYISPFASIRGNGYGRELLKSIINDQASKHGFKTIAADVRNKSTVDLNAYYQNFGFQKGDTVPWVWSVRNVHSITRYLKQV